MRNIQPLDRVPSEGNGVHRRQLRRLKQQLSGVMIPCPVDQLGAGDGVQLDVHGFGVKLNDAAS